MIEEIKKIISKASGISEVLVEASKDQKHGDYSTNVALILSKKLNKNPKETAEEIKNKIKNNIFEKIEVAGPGFINFYLSKNFFVGNLKKINNNFGKNRSLANKKIIVEYTDPNPFKEFHIGHLMSNSIGESISRILEFHGAKVKRANYQGDVGLHVAKAIWGKMKHSEKKWQDAYQIGSEAYESDETAKQEILVLNKKIFERSDEAVNKLYDQGKKESLVYFEKIYGHLGTKFDYYFFESQVSDFGKKLVEKNIDKVFETGEKGALVFKGEKYGLHTRVFVNSEGLPTYEAKELGLAKIKYDKYKYGRSIIITGKEINEYFKVLLCAMKEIFPDLAEKTNHIGHGMLRLPEGKMSSRAGKIITAEFLFGEAEKLIARKMEERDFKDKDDVIEKVALSALKYSILKQSIGSDIIYDFDKSISFEGDSGPYLQYSYVRANSITEKAKQERVKPSFKEAPEMGNLEKLMSRFPEVVEKAGKEYEPHLITTYLTELAREFNNYYSKNKVVDKQDPYSPYKVALTQAFAIVMKNGLWLLGISAPEKM